MANYHFPFAVNGTPNVGDVVTWDGQQWIPQAATGVGTWAQVLQNGEFSNGKNPTISDGDTLNFLGRNGQIVAEIDLEVTAGQQGNADNGGAITLAAGEALDTGSGGQLNLLAGNSANGEGGRIIITAGDSVNTSGGFINLTAGNGNVGGGSISITAGDGATDSGGSAEIIAGNGEAGGSVSISSGDALAVENSGGNVDILAGSSPGGEIGTGGNIFCEPGTSGSLATAGSIRLRHAGGEDAIVIAQEPAAPHLGNRAILITATGLSFFNGTPAERPSVSGSRGGNAALASLLTVLDSMGLISDNTTA